MGLVTGDLSQRIYHRGFVIRDLSHEICLRRFLIGNLSQRICHNLTDDTSLTIYYCDLSLVSFDGDLSLVICHRGFVIEDLS